MKTKKSSTRNLDVRNLRGVLKKKYRGRTITVEEMDQAIRKKAHEQEMALKGKLNINIDLDLSRERQHTAHYVQKLK